MNILLERGVTFREPRPDFCFSICVTWREDSPEIVKKKGEKRRNRSGRIPSGNWRARTALVRIPYKISLCSARSTPPGCILGPSSFVRATHYSPYLLLVLSNVQDVAAGTYATLTRGFPFSSTNLHRPSLFSSKITLFFRENLWAPPQTPRKR